MGTPTAFDDSRFGDKHSNGIRDVKGLIRTLRADLQDNIKAPVHIDSGIVPWIVRHAGHILTRCRVHPCGKTAMQRMKGQNTHRPMLSFGEVVMLKTSKHEAKGRRL